MDDGWVERKGEKDDKMEGRIVGGRLEGGKSIGKKG